MTTFDASLERARAERAQLDPRKVALTLAAVLPFVLGWLVRKVFTVVWLVVSWLWIAALTGWREAAPKGETS